MNALNFNFYDRRIPLPVVLLIDPQRSDVAGFCPPAAERVGSIAQCRLALGFARRHGFPIAMTRWRASGTRFRGWVEGLEPRASEMIFDQPQASCYSSETFAEMMSEGGGGHNAVLACPVNADAWISTAADAARHGHRITFLSDASATLPLEAEAGAGWGHGATHIHQQCRSMTTQTWMSSQLAALRGELGGK
jgi:nicotinamidase-related amidase